MQQKGVTSWLMLSAKMLSETLIEHKGKYMVQANKISYLAFTAALSAVNAFLFFYYGDSYS